MIKRVDGFHVVSFCALLKILFFAQSELDCLCVGRVTLGPKVAVLDWERKLDLKGNWATAAGKRQKLILLWNRLQPTLFISGMLSGQRFCSSKCTPSPLPPAYALCLRSLASLPTTRILVLCPSFPIEREPNTNLFLSDRWCGAYREFLMKSKKKFPFIGCSSSCHLTIDSNTANSWTGSDNWCLFTRVNHNNKNQLTLFCRLFTFPHRAGSSISYPFSYIRCCLLDC